MEEKQFESKDTVEIDLSKLFGALLQKAWAIVLTAVLGAVAAFCITFFLITPQYKASAMFYVNNSSVSVGDASFSISSADLSTSRNLVDSYIVILTTRETLLDVIDYAGVNRSIKEMKEMISAASVNETEIFKVSVTSSDPKEAEQIASAIAHILPKRISTIIDGTSAKVVDSAVLPVSPSSPSYPKNIIIGFLIGVLLSAGVVVLREIFDVTVRTEEDVAVSCKYPLLVSVPDMTASSKGGSYYNESKKRKKGGAYAATKTAPKHPSIIGPDISFAASEAYKLLRTKLQFSFVDENDCRVIGLSSALSGEGKSLTSVNLAYTLSQLDKKVILIDCDMRRPTLAEKLGIRKAPGLSNYLTGQCHLQDSLQSCGLKGDANAFHVITAGQNPPNPIELLSSKRMTAALDVLRQHYDYVILDLPPVGEVSDAMAVAKETDGMLLVVRQNYCNRIVLSDAVRQFEFIQSKILGVVFNCTVESSGKYGKQYYKKYYKKYYTRPYEKANSYDTANKRRNF